MNFKTLLDKKPVNFVITNSCTFNPAQEYPHFLLSYNARLRNGGMSKYTHVENHTSGKIDLHDSYGEVITLFKEPTDHNQYNNVVVIRVCTIIPGDSIFEYHAEEVEYWYSEEQLSKEPLYDIVTNYVISKFNISGIVHPYICKISTDYLKYVFDELRCKIQNNSVVVLANDPDELIDKLYYIFNGRICQVAVSHLKNEDAFFKIRFSASRDDDEFEYISISLDDIKNGKCKFISPISKSNILDTSTEVNDKCLEYPLFVSTNKYALEREYRQHVSNISTDKCVTDVKEDYENKLKQLHKDYADQLSDLKQKHKSDIQKLQQKLTISEEKNERQDELEKERLKTKQTVSQEKQLNIKESESEYSMIGTALKVAIIAIPIVVAITKFILTPASIACSLISLATSWLF